MRIEIGKTKDYKDRVTKLDFNKHPYWLDYQSAIPKLYSSNCPHQGGTVAYSEKESCFVCPVHQWRFDVSTGRSINAPKYKLKTFPVYEKAGKLYTNIPAFLLERTASNTSDSIRVPNVRIKQHSHACIEIKTENFRLICDPWLEGNAFLGSWAHYPPAASKVKDLSPDAIWISHEHSDHFHEPTLKKFDKSIPIYVPAFPNGRMEKKLEDLGFKTIHSIPFGKTVKLTTGFEITIYEPASLWNDAFVLIEVDGLRFLNLNDAGINRNIAAKIGPVDIIASSFSPGASGYPATWTHLSEKEKISIMIQSKKGVLEMLGQATAVYGAKVVLPFASHFTLWHESHKPHYKILQRNSIEDVVNYFAGTEIDVIDVLPGDTWHSSTREISRGQNRVPELSAYIAEQQGNELPLPLRKESIDEKQVITYFEQLNHIPEMIFSENLTFKVGWGDNQLYFEIKDGSLTQTKEVLQPNLSMKIPSALLKWIIEENESWDEATIGYWCEFSRNPDVYHADFWRLLQTPYYKKNAQITSYTSKNSIAEILEEKGELAAKIMGRYGLHCIGCAGSTEETIEQGIKAHGLSMGDKTRLMKELNQI